MNFHRDMFSHVKFWQLIAALVSIAMGIYGYFNWNHMRADIRGVASDVREAISAAAQKARIEQAELAATAERARNEEARKAAIAEKTRNEEARRQADAEKIRNEEAKRVADAEKVRNSASDRMAAVEKAGTAEAERATGDKSGLAGKPTPKSTEPCTIVGYRIERPVSVVVGSQICNKGGAIRATVHNITSYSVIYSVLGGQQVTCRKSELCTFDWEGAPLFHVDVVEDMGVNSRRALLLNAR
jgi:hypothetical protein